jgi:hypothetical protein
VTTPLILAWGVCAKATAAIRSNARKRLLCLLICIWEPRDSTGVYHSHIDSNGSIVPDRTRCEELISHHHHRCSDRSSIPEHESRVRRDLLAESSISISEPLRQFPDLRLRVHLPFGKSVTRGKARRSATSGEVDWITPRAVFHTLRMSHTTATITTMVPSNPKPSISFLL